MTSWQALIVSLLLAVLINHAWTRRASGRTGKQPAAPRADPPSDAPRRRLGEALDFLAIEDFTERFARDAMRSLEVDPGIDYQYFRGATSVFDGNSESSPVRVCTVGLGQRGQLEFELLEVPPALLDAARMLLHNLALYSDWQTSLSAGATFRMETPVKVVLAGRVVEAESDGRKVLRVCDMAETGSQLARDVLLGAAILKARDYMLRKPEPEQARRLLEAVISMLPVAHDAHDAHETVNAHHSFAFLTLSDLGVERETNYFRALERDGALLSMELGGPLPPPLEHAELVAAAHALVVALQDGLLALAGELEPNEDDAIGLVLTPVLRIEGDQLQQHVAPGPLMANDYYYRSPVRERLREPATAQLAAELYARAVREPSVILVQTLDVARDIYQCGFRFENKCLGRPAPAGASAFNGLAHLPMLARILADLGRSFAAGLSEAELRARFGLVTNQGDATSAQRKLAVLRERERPALMKALEWARVEVVTQTSSPSVVN